MEKLEYTKQQATHDKKPM